MEKILDFFMRIIGGVLAIWVVNSLMETMGLPRVVGVNALSVLTCGILGFPGFVALYAFGICKVL